MRRDFGRVYLALEQVVEHRAQLVGGRLDALRVLAPVGLGDRLVGREDLGEAADDRQRRAKVVPEAAAALVVAAVAHDPSPSGPEMKPSRRAIATACTRVCAS